MNTRTIRSLILFGLLAGCGTLQAEEKLDRALPVRGFCIECPRANHLDEFIKFINEELAPRAVNTLILRVEYNYQFETHPELKETNGLTKADVKKLVTACTNNHLRVIPQINLLGHQSWASRCGNLLRTYPEFDETPGVKFPEKYAWPNADRLYCKSYCPLHPKVHDVVFALMDEICDAFETDAFHAGLDEVFYIGEDQCPRCSGRDKAELFAGEVRAIRDHLRQKGRTLWMWGDRLLDGKTTGLGEWEASLNNTHRAIDLIPKDVIVCDWHYDRADQTAVYFAMKGLQVVTCPWNKPQYAVLQVQDMARFRERSTPAMRDRFLGVAETIWSGADSFLNEFYGKRTGGETKENTPSKCFVKMYEEIETLKDK